MIWGDCYFVASGGLHALICGGNWNNGVHDGSRTVNCNNYPWNVNTNIGVRCVCDYIPFLDWLIPGLPTR